MQFFSYHTHTTFSDGQNTLEEMIEQAERLELKEIGISDHLIVHKNISKTENYEHLKKLSFTNFQDAYEQCSQHIENLRRLQKEHQIKIRVGFETDFFIYDGWYEEFETLIQKLDHDYLINGNHFLMNESGENIFDITYIVKNNKLKDKLKLYIKRHFETMEKAVRSNKFSFLAHLDYVKKLSEYQETDFDDEIKNVINALRETQTGSELNTKGLRRSTAFYPSNNILEELIRSDIPLLVSDDAHNANELCFEFESADKLLNKLKAKRFSFNFNN